jgi:hypothetical protein
MHLARLFLGSVLQTAWAGFPESFLRLFPALNPKPREAGSGGPGLAADPQQLITT